MGRFSTTVHVKDNVGRIEFINSFCGIMKIMGLCRVRRTRRNSRMCSHSAMVGLR